MKKEPFGFIRFFFVVRVARLVCMCVKMRKSYTSISDLNGIGFYIILQSLKMV